MLLKLGFLASHGGSSMKAVVAAIERGSLAARARLVISNNAESAALQFARAQGLPWRHISAQTSPDPDAAIAEALQGAGVDWVILSGYMRRLGPVTLQRFKGRILNIHPALLPKYGGQGMYGRRVHEAVHAAGDAVSGASIHLVESDYDTGPVIARREVPINPGDNVKDIDPASGRSSLDCSWRP